MTWTAPRTWVTAEVVTAALMNTHLRDNMLETAPATATTAGDLVYADAANSMGSRVGIGATGSVLGSDGSSPVWRSVATDDASGSASSATTTSVDLGAVAWFGTDVEVQRTTGATALIFLRAHLENNTAGERTTMYYRIYGATAQVATNDRSIHYESSVAADSAEFGTHYLETGLTPGSNTFRLTANVSAGTGLIARPRITVMPL